MIGNTMNMIRNHGVKAAAMAVVGLGLCLGGCNNSVKEQNAKLMEENTQLRERTASAESERAALQSQMAALQAQQAAAPTQYPNQYSDYQQPGSGGRSTSVRTQNRETVITVAGDVLFSSGSATIKPEARKELDGVVRQIKSQHSGYSVRVEGYTDSDPIRKSKWGSNEALSQARAEAVRDYLSSKGVSSSRLTAVGMGAAKPKANKKDSRRVEVVIVDN